MLIPSLGILPAALWVCGAASPRCQVSFGPGTVLRLPADACAPAGSLQNTSPRPPRLTIVDAWAQAGLNPEPGVGSTGLLGEARRLPSRPRALRWTRGRGLQTHSSRVQREGVPLWRPLAELTVQTMR